MKKLTKAKKNQICMIAAVFVSVIVLIMAATGIVAQIYNKAAKKDDGADYIDDSVIYSEYDVPKPDITEMLLTPNVNSRPGIALESVDGVVIHYTANPGSDAEANRDYFESRKDQADEREYKVSSHFIIGIDGEIIQCIPLDEIAYASNDRNSDTISIECCHKSANGRFSRATYRSLVKLVAWLCCEYELAEEDIIRHYDVTGKMCPLYYVRHEDAWQRLKDKIWSCFLSYQKK